MTVTGIVVCEGADASGKTTLARHLVERYDARYLHNGIHREMWTRHAGALRRAVRLAETRLVVVDRLWLSELVYGRVFRGGPAYDVGARCFDRVLRRYGAVTVLCAPLDQRAQAQRWASGRAAGKHEHFDRVEEVIRLYADLRHGNVAHPGDGYLDQLIRFQDFAERDDVMIYDLDHYSGDRGVARFAQGLVERLSSLGRAVVPRRGFNLAGRPTSGFPATLFVGEAISPRTPSYATPPWPWCDRDDRQLSATWLNRAIHQLRLREDRLVFTNALPPPGSESHLAELLFGPYPKPRVIALGGVAAEKLERLGVEFAYVCHPAWHKRFHHGEGPAGYAERLREVLR